MKKGRGYGRRRGKSSRRKGGRGRGRRVSSKYTMQRGGISL